MASIELLGLPQLKRKMSRAERQVFPRALARAINNTAKRMRTATVRSVSKAMGLKQAPIRRRIIVRKRAKPNDPVAVMEATGKPMNLINFDARALKRGGVSHRAWGRRRKEKHLFIRTMPQGGTIVVKRDRSGKRIQKGPNKGAPALTAVWGPGIAKETADEAMARERQLMVGTRLPMELERELRFRVQRLKGA